MPTKKVQKARVTKKPSARVAKKLPVKKRRPIQKKAATPKKHVEPLAMRLLGKLPALDEKRRKAYRAAFTDAQCDAWGTATQAKTTLADAERAVERVYRKLTHEDITGYGTSRLAWLCHLMVDLQDAMQTQRTHKDSRTPNLAVTVATQMRQRLVVGLTSMTGGDESLRQQIAERDERSSTPHALESSLAGLLQLALQWRRTEFGEVLGDDGGMTEKFLSSISAIIDSLRETNEHTYGDETHADSAETNRIEGRVLRELDFLCRSFSGAKTLGESVPPLPTLKSLDTVRKNNPNN